MVAGGIGFGQALANASALVRILRPKIEELALQAQGESIFEEYPASPSPCGSVFCLVAGGIGFGQALANASALVRILRPKIEELARKYIISLAIYLFLLHISL